MREPARLAHERVAVQEHERRLRRTARSAASAARGATAAVTGRRRRSPVCTCTGSGSPVAALSSSAPITSRCRSTQPAPVGGDRLRAPRNRRRARVATAAARCRLDPQHRERRAPRDLAQLAPVHRELRRREAVVDQQRLRARRAQQRGRVLRAGRAQPVLEHRRARRGSTPKCAASTPIARRYVTAVATCGHWRGSSLSENSPRNSSSVRGGSRRMPCACWSTTAIELSTSRSDPGARIPRPPRSRPPTRSGGRPGRSARGRHRARPSSTSSAASASSASAWVAGSGVDPARRALLVRQRRRVDVDRRPAASARARSRRAPRR